MTPFVLIEITKDSRLRVLQDAGVRVGFVDHRVDPVLTIFGAADQAAEINQVTALLPVISPGNDDFSRTAAEMIRRIANGELVVVGLAL
jgi:hypothetical protein